MLAVQLSATALDIRDLMQGLNSMGLATTKIGASLSANTLHPVLASGGIRKLFLSMVRTGGKVALRAMGVN